MNRYNYTKEECFKLGAYFGRSCCHASAKVKYAYGLQAIVSTCVQLKNDKKILDAINLVGDEALTYLPEDMPYSPSKYNIVCSSNWIKTSFGLLLGLLILL